MLRLILRICISLIFLLAVVICANLFPLAEFFYKAGSEEDLQEKHRDKLLELAAHSLRSKDVPVGALLLYNGEVIGEGYNTVSKDSVAGGHAEMNAITRALKKMGVTQFFKLDRNRLELLTTLEPCEMCKGAIVEYRIKQVRFMKGKDLDYWLTENKWRLLYQYNKQQTSGAALQDSLFHLHPAYSKD